MGRLPDLDPRRLAGRVRVARRAARRDPRRAGPADPDRGHDRRPDPAALDPVTDGEHALAGLELTAHHRRAIDRLIAKLEPDPDILALLLAGSIAHGYARP